MPIIALQRHIREVGRIRLGVQVEAANGRTRPKKLETFRFTSVHRAVVEATAELYGGDVHPWSNDGRAEFENVSATDEIPIALQPNGMGWEQWHEAWAKGYLVHRCDGAWDTAKDEPCSCDPEERACATTSRLSVILPEVPGLGVWRMESHGWYAARELAGALDIIDKTAQRGVVLRANLRLEPRSRRRLVEGKAVKYDFAVPVIDMPVSFEALAAGGHGAEPAALAESPVALEAPRRPEPTHWKPVPIEAPVPARTVTADEQMAALEKPKPPRKNAAKAIERATAPRQTCTVCSEPYGADDSLVPNPEKGPAHSRFIHARHLSEVFQGEGPASQGQPGGPDGKDGGARSAAEPVRVAGASTTTRAADAMSNLQRGKLHALAGELWPGPGDPLGMTSGEVNTLRHDRMLALCAALGAPGLESRADIDRALAAKVIDALEALRAGTLELVGTELREVGHG